MASKQPKSKPENRGQQIREARMTRKAQVAKTVQPNREAVIIEEGKFEGRSREEQQREELRILSLMHPGDMTTDQRSAFKALRAKYN